MFHTNKLRVGSICSKSGGHDDDLVERYSLNVMRASIPWTKPEMNPHTWGGGERRGTFQKFMPNQQLQSGSSVGMCCAQICTFGARLVCSVSAYRRSFCIGVCQECVVGWAGAFFLFFFFFFLVTYAAVMAGYAWKPGMVW